MLRAAGLRCAFARCQSAPKAAMGVASWRSGSGDVHVGANLRCGTNSGKLSIHERALLRLHSVPRQCVSHVAQGCSFAVCPGGLRDAAGPGPGPVPVPQCRGCSMGCPCRDDSPDSPFTFSHSAVLIPPEEAPSPSVQHGLSLLWD